MAVNELVSSRANEHVSRKDKRTMGNGFRLYRNVRSDRGVQRVPRPEKVEGRKPGRPLLYGKEERDYLATYLVK
jgi:hypothetical protein